MFLFIKYIQPIWYYRLAERIPAPVLADFRQLTFEFVNLIQYDLGYSNEAASLMDAAYQGLFMGVIPSMNTCLKGSSLKPIVSVGDNYRFIRKHFGTHWYLYVFFIRIITLHNPFEEIRWFLRSWSFKRFILRREAALDDGTVIKENPFVTVVIPTLNRYVYLKDVLADLEKQDYRAFEVIICDQSNPVDENFYQGWNLDLKFIKQEEKALWLARNTCIKKATGTHILLFDDDSRVEPDWISQHLACLERFRVSISAGVTHTLVGHGMSTKESYFHLSDIFDTGNAMVKREVFEKVGLFDRQFEKQRNGDGEFGLRACLSGFQIIANPFAKRIHLKGGSGGLREMGSWDAFRTKNLFAPRPIPSVLYFSRKYFGKSASIFLLLISIPGSFTSYEYKGKRWAKYLGAIGSFLLLPLIVFQVLKSWNKSSIKIREGARIEFLDSYS